MPSRKPAAPSKSNKAKPAVGPLRATLKRQANELDAIREICRSINATSDVRSILAGITNTTTKTMGVDSTSIYLLDAQSQRLI